MIEATAAPPIVPATPRNEPRIAAVAAARAPATICGIDRPDDLTAGESSSGVAPPPVVLVEICAMAPRARCHIGVVRGRIRAADGVPASCGSICPDVPQGASVASR